VLALGARGHLSENGLHVRDRTATELKPLSQAEA
jgi:hypothetical protein